MRWGVDISRYDEVTDAHWQAMTNNGLSFAIIRACHGAGYTDPYLPRHVTQAKNYGIPFGLYQWVDITQDIQKQVDYFLHLIEQYSPKCAACDFEQYWTDWDAWNRARLGGTNPIPTMPPEQINAFYLECFTKMKARLNIPLVSYTGSWFVNQYSPQMSAWLGQSYLWLASYISSPSGVIDWNTFEGIVKDLGTPIFPVGLNRWDTWQFSTSLSITGIPHIDMDAVISEEIFNNLFISSRIYEPPAGGITQKARVIASPSLRVRDAPNIQAQILRSMPYGTLVEVEEIQNGWARLVAGGWCLAQWLQLLDETPEPPPADTTPPAAIMDLTATTGVETGSVDLSWTSPGNDANLGTASNYLVCYSPTAITNQASWEMAAVVNANIPFPKPAGQPEKMSVGGLTPGKTYYFMVRAQDEASNLGGLSNNPPAIAKAPGVALPCVARTIAGSGLRVRAAGNLSAQILRILQYNTLVVVVEIKDGWGNLADGGWCLMQWLRLFPDEPVPQQDLTPPAAIMDIVATTGTEAGSVELTWTAPGDDAHTGTAESYLVCHSLSVIDSPEAWDSAESVTSSLPAPHPAGQTERLIVRGLTPGTLYYFAVRAKDEASNMSGMSNSPSAIAKTQPPSQSKRARVKATAGLRVRAAPDLQAQILRALPYNTVIEIEGIENGWAHLVEGGWCSAQYLEVLE